VIKGSEHHRPRHRGQVQEQVTLALGVERDQVQRRVEHGLAVAQEEEEQEEHDDEAHQRAQRLDHEDAAHRDGHLEQPGRRAHEPLLDLLGAHRRHRFRPLKELMDKGNTEQIAGPRDLIASGRRLELLE
jgi:hypothetical protein